MQADYGHMLRVKTKKNGKRRVTFSSHPFVPVNQILVVDDNKLTEYLPTIPIDLGKYTTTDYEITMRMKMRYSYAVIR